MPGKRLIKSSHQIYFQEYEYTRQNGCPKMSPPQPPWNLWIGYVTEQNGLCRYKNGHRFWNRKVILGYPNGPIWSHDPVRAENFLCQILTVAEVRDKQEIDFTCHYLRQQYWKHFSFYKWRPAPTDKSTRQEERQSCNCMQSTIQMNWKVDSSSETPPSPKNVALWAYWFRLWETGLGNPQHVNKMAREGSQSRMCRSCQRRCCQMWKKISAKFC